jgi:CarD family transcriptional regulator
MQTASEFKVGDKAVYPAQGVTEVVSIDERDIAGARQRFYVLRILDSDKRIMVPVKNAGSVGLRSVVSETEVGEVFELLRERAVGVDNQKWIRRARTFKDKIRTGSIYDAAEVVRDLYRIKVEKGLSSAEKQMLETARALVVKEIAIARAWTDEQTISEIEAIFVTN